MKKTLILITLFALVAVMCTSCCCHFDNYYYIHSCTINITDQTCKVVIWRKHDGLFNRKFVLPVELYDDIDQEKVFLSAEEVDEYFTNLKLEYAIEKGWIE